MRILGIDPGSYRTGYGLIDVAGRQVRHVDNGVIAPGQRLKLPARLVYIFEQLGQIIATHRPSCAVVEEIFFAKNVQSMVSLGQARGVAILAAARAELQVHEYSPRLVKQTVVSYGNASKAQIQFMTAKFLSLSEVASEDAADALAVAITHAHHQLAHRP